MKLIKFLSIISLTTFLSLFSISDTSAVENPVVPNGKLGELRHGTFPSPPLGDFTHVGVDLVAPCGSYIYAFSDGQVKDIIDNTNDKNFNTLGYMVLIEHPASLIGKKFYTLYLHMQRPPEVKIGSQVTGGRTVIGNVGSSGKTLGGCHTHFEIRYFPERFSTWGNIYCPDDQRYSEYFKRNWEDPLTFFRKYPNRVKLVKTSGRDNNADKSKLILGSWKYEDGGVMEYFRDGTFMLNTYAGEKKAGKWNINGDTLTLRFYIHTKAYTFKILELSSYTYKIVGTGVNRNTSNARRIEPTKQSPVYVAKNSRVYHHNRNCPKLTATNNLMEFSSPEKAKASGSIPCGHCKPSTYDREEEQSRRITPSDAQTKTDSNEGAYVGELKEGKKHGHGTLTMPNGDKYVGEWEENYRHGRGTYTLTDGTKYEGAWKNGMADGQGTYTWPNGEKNVGRWENDKQNGHGTMTRANGEKYVGEWKDDTVQRFYKYTSKNKVKFWPSMDDLVANPFVYEGKIIGISASFWKMESATSGVFTEFTEAGGDLFPLIIIVSNITKGLFTTSDIRVILTGKVLGTIEFQMPVLGPTQVPHLEFIDYMLPDK